MSKPNLKVTGVALIFTVQNLERTGHFYAKTLGLELEQLEGGARHVATGRVRSRRSGGSARRARCIELLTPVTEAPGGWSVEFKDPDGHGLAFYQDGALPRRH
jgi:glyoxylase I family protein